MSGPIDPNRSDTTILYIVSLSHSGSTLLDLLVSSHGDAVSVGEAKRYSRRIRSPMNCTCRAPTVWECPFWQRVDAELGDMGLVSLRSIDLCGGDDEIFVAHNIGFYQAIRKITGRRTIVDSSKNEKRLLRLLRLRPVDVRPVHLIRRPHGVVYSQVKKGRDWVRCSLDWAKKTRRTRRLLQEFEHQIVRYEELATDPARVLQELMPRLGLSFEEQQLEWAGRERHNCGGNRMRRSSSSDIRLDEGWRDGLNPWQKAGVSVLTMGAGGP